MVKKFQPFVGKNWFNEREAIDTLAAKLKLTTNLKVVGEDVPDIDVDDHRITVTIEQGGRIQSFRKG
jgi:hypothetical protein